MRTALSVLAFVVLCQFALAQEYYISPDGNDVNPGTAASPMATLDKAAKLLTPGDTLWVRDGRYATQPPAALRCSGTEQAPVRIFAVAGARPVFDFAGKNGPGIHVKRSWCHLKGITVERAGYNGFKISGEDATHITLENCTARTNGNTGFHLGSGASYVTLLNCDSYENFDPGRHGQDADGFGAKHDIGPGNKFIGCRSWSNSDDGYDLWYAENQVRFEGCFAWANGVNLWKDPLFEGNGNGFKLGQMGSSHILVQCAAWDQPASGFDLNGNSAGVTVTNCTAFRCKTNFDFVSKKGNIEKNVLRNNISLQGPNKIDPKVDDKDNSWNTPGLELTKADFQSLDPNSMAGPRSPDGSLPKSNFLHLTPASKAKGLGAFN
jgi:hypothetical protein